MGFLCQLGFHVGSFVYYKGSGSCEQRRACTRADCHNIKYQTEHTFGSFELINPGNKNRKKSCESKRTCERCGYVEVDALHNYEWRYGNDNSCWQRETCIRCGDRRGATRTNHPWGDWAPCQDSARLERICGHCGLRQKK